MHNKVRNRVSELLDLFPGLDSPKVKFNLKGKCAGQCCFSGTFTLRFNLKLLKENEEDYLKFTVPHEVAHMITYMVYGKVRPHGKEWKNVMYALGVRHPQRCHHYDLGEPWKYKCDCQVHYLSNRQHEIARSGRSYVCNLCKTELKFIKKRLDK
jgi:SprT protein